MRNHAGDPEKQDRLVFMALSELRKSILSPGPAGSS